MKEDLKEKLDKIIDPLQKDHLVFMQKIFSTMEEVFYLRVEVGKLEANKMNE